MATMTLCNAVFMLMLLAALSKCHGNAFGAWSGKQRQRKKKLAIYRAWPWIWNCWEWDSNSGLSGIESSALTTRPSRLSANLRCDATSRLLFLDQSVLADFDPRKKKRSRILRLVAFQARVISSFLMNTSLPVLLLVPSLLGMLPQSPVPLTDCSLEAKKKKALFNCCSRWRCA